MNHTTIGIGIVMLAAIGSMIVVGTNLVPIQSYARDSGWHGKHGGDSKGIKFTLSPTFTNENSNSNKNANKNKASAENNIVNTSPSSSNSSSDGSKSGGSPQTSSFKKSIREDVRTSLEHKNQVKAQHADFENLCLRTHDCRNSNVGQQIQGNDNSVTGFADQSSNAQPSANNSTTPEVANDTSAR
jgi:hypothetical protein